MVTTAVPVRIEPEAQERIDQLGYHREFEQILEHAMRAIPGLKKIDVTAPFNEVMGLEQQVMIEAYVDGMATLEPELEFERWAFHHFPNNVLRCFVLVTADG